MTESQLALNQKCTTAHSRAYSGNLASLVSHSDGNRDYRPYDYVDTEKLRAFLVAEGAIVGHEIVLDDGTNGTRFWSFHPDPQEHQKIIEKRTGSNSDGRKYFIYHPADPMLLEHDQCGLVTNAFVATPEERKSGTHYTSSRPEQFTLESVLRVDTIVQMKPYIFDGYANRRYASKNEKDHINAVLTDVRNKLYENLCENAKDATQLWVSFGGYGVYYGIQGVTLRTASHDDYLWAQVHMLPALKKILDNPSVGDAAVILQELAEIKLPSSSDVKDEMRRLVLDARRESGQKIIDATMTHYYTAAIERACRELQSDEEVTRALKLM